MNEIVLSTAALIAILGAVLAGYGTLIASHTISNTAGVGVALFQDSNCTNPVTSINWGMLNPGVSANYTLYVKNTGTVPVTLTMTTGNWNPPAAAGNFTVTWNQQNTILAASSCTSAVLTLNVSAIAIGIASVTFDITITGTQ